jgi:hypothetical protein
MVTAAERELAAAGVTEAPEVVVADAGYWHHDQRDTITGRGITLLIPPDAGKRKGARPGWDGGRYAFMRRVLETDAGAALYSKRQGMIEPVFANTKFNRRLDRFLRRGRAACRSEWRLITATHNLLKLHTPDRDGGSPTAPRASRRSVTHPRLHRRGTHPVSTLLRNSHDEKRKSSLLCPDRVGSKRYAPELSLLTALGSSGCASQYAFSSSVAASNPCIPAGVSRNQYRCRARSLTSGWPTIARA